MLTFDRNFQEGDTLYFIDPYLQDYRPGTVYQKLNYQGMMYYILEVDAGPPINDTYLVMKSMMNVYTQDDVDYLNSSVDEEDPID